MKRRVAIVGGGLAGIAAALRLIDAGDEPILLESSKRLGGRASSFTDPRTGETLDNCQHVLMGCCTNLIDLYERLGVLDTIEWHRRVYWTAGNDLIDTMQAGWLPAPLHLSGAFRRMKLFGPAEKRHLARAMWKIIRLGSRGRLAWRDRTFGEFLEECQQPEALVQRFWNAIVVSACNLDVARVGAEYALQVFQDGFLANRWAYSVGLPRVPLRELYLPAIDRIIEGGGDIKLGASARSIAYDGNRVTGVVTGDEMIEASAVISAVPFDRLDKLVSKALRRADRRLGGLHHFTHSPILGIHLFFDQQVMTLPHLTIVDHDIQWLFNKGADDEGVQHIHVVISGADEWMDRTEQDISERVVADLHSALPRTVGLKPIRTRVIKERRATFAPVPGIHQHRPSAAPGTVGLDGGGVENLFLAGDWTDVGWPSTMEGAVRSGYAAAIACTGQGGLVEDLPPALLSRLLGLG